MMRKLIAGALVAGILVTTGCGGGGGGSDNEEPTDPTIVSTGETVDVSTPSAETSPQQQNVDVLVGERLAVERAPDLVVEAFRRTFDGQSVGDGAFVFELDPGDEYLVLTLTVINDTELPAGIDPLFELSLLSRAVDIDARYKIVGVRDALEADVLPVSAEASGSVVWTAVAGFDQLTLEYSPEGTGRTYLVGLDGDFSTEPAPGTDDVTPSLSSDDEEEIEELVDELAEMFANEDWSRAYDLLPPSARETCSKGRYLAGVAVAIEFVKELFGDEAWDALQEDAKDGWDVTSIEPVPGGAIAYTLESGEDGLTMVFEDGEWWTMDDIDDDPCELLFN